MDWEEENETRLDGTTKERKGKERKLRISI